MAWVYLLRGASGRHYLGSTTDLDRRLREHERGHTATTRRLGGNLQLLAACEMPSLAAARALERHLKLKRRPDLILWHLQQPNSSGCESLPPAQW